MSFNPIVRICGTTSVQRPPLSMLLLELPLVVASRMRDQRLCLRINPLSRANSPAHMPSVRHAMPTASRRHQPLSPVLANAVLAVMAELTFILASVEHCGWAGRDRLPQA